MNREDIENASFGYRKTKKDLKLKKLQEENEALIKKVIELTHAGQILINAKPYNTEEVRHAAITFRYTDTFLRNLGH